MADRLLLESGAPDGYLLEDGTGVLLLEEPPQFGRPDGVTTISGSWVGVSDNTDLHLNIDETSFDDADYVESPSNPGAGTLIRFSLSALNTPSVDTGHIFRYRIGKDATSGRLIEFVVRLRQGETVIREWTHTDVDAMTTIEQTLTEVEAATITDYEALEFGFDPTVSGGGAARKAVLSWAELEVPYGAPAVIATPTTAALTLSTFAPTVSATAHQTATPAAATLTIATFAPAVTASDHQLVTPTTAALVTATFVPTVTTTQNVTVTPGIAALTTATFAPSVAATDHKLLTPGVTALTIATFAPTATATDHKTVTPTTAALTLSAFAPSVTGGAGLTVTPGTIALTLSTFAPNVSVSDNIIVTPDIAALNLAAFAPTVTASDHQTVTPTTTTLALATFAPVVTVAGGSVSVTPGTLALALLGYSTTVTASGASVETPRRGGGRLLAGSAVVVGPARVRRTDPKPRVLVNAHQIVIPGTLALTLLMFAPTVTASVSVDDEYELVLLGLI